MKKSKKIDFDFVVLMLRKTSVYFACFLNKLKVTPNQVTIFRFFIFGIGAAYCFYKGTYLFNIVGLILLFLNFYLDLVDGDLARNYDKKSKLGKFLEDLLDPLLLIIIILSLVFNLFVNNNVYKYFGLLCLFGQIFSLKMSLYFQYNFNINCVEGNNLLESNLKGKKLSLFEFFVRELITPKNFFISLFSNFRYYLVVGVLFNLMPLSFLLYSIAINIRWITLSIFLLIFNSDFNIKKRMILLAEFEKLQQIPK